MRSQLVFKEDLGRNGKEPVLVKKGYIYIYIDYVLPHHSIAGTTINSTHFEQGIPINLHVALQLCGGCNIPKYVDKSYIFIEHMHACWYLLVKWYLHDSTRVSRWRRWLRASSPCCTLPEVLLFFTKIVSGTIKNSWIKCRFLHLPTRKGSCLGSANGKAVTFPQRSGFAIANPIHLPQLQVYTPNIADCLKLESPFSRQTQDVRVYFCRLSKL